MSNKLDFNFRMENWHTGLLTPSDLRLFISVCIVIINQIVTGT